MSSVEVMICVNLICVFRALLKYLADHDWKYRLHWNIFQGYDNIGHNLDVQLQTHFFL